MQPAARWWKQCWPKETVMENAPMLLFPYSYTGFPLCRSGGEVLWFAPCFPWIYQVLRGFFFLMILPRLLNMPFWRKLIQLCLLVSSEWFQSDWQKKNPPCKSGFSLTLLHLVCLRHSNRFNRECRRWEPHYLFAICELKCQDEPDILHS